MAEEWQVDMWVPREESCLLWGSCLSPPLLDTLSVLPDV